MGFGKQNDVKTRRIRPLFCIQWAFLTSRLFLFLSQKKNQNQLLKIFSQTARKREAKILLLRLFSWHMSMRKFYAILGLTTFLINWYSEGFFWVSRFFCTRLQSTLKWMFSSDTRLTAGNGSSCSVSSHPFFPVKAYGWCKKSSSQESLWFLSPEKVNGISH